MHRLRGLRAGMPAGSDQGRYRGRAGKVAVPQRGLFQILAQYQPEGRTPGRCKGDAGRSGQVREVLRPGARPGFLGRTGHAPSALPVPVTAETSQTVEFAALLDKPKIN